MAGIEDLGNGIGYIYTVLPDGTTIESPTRNTPDGARNIKVEGVQAQSTALNRKATGTITLGTPSGVGTITSIACAGFQQIDIAVPIAYTGATTATALAILVRDAINDFSTGSEKTTFTATSSGAVVTVIASALAGSSYNTLTSVVTSTGFLTYSATEISGGSAATELYDEAIGYRFFLNSDYDSGGCGGSSTPATPDSLLYAIEITNYIIPRSLTSAIDSQNVTIASDAISFTRESLETLIQVDTEAAAGTDDLSTISVVGFAEGDLLIVRGKDNTHIVTVKDGVDNIQLQGAVDFVTAETETALTLQLIGSIWYEVSRTTQTIGAMADFRTAGFGFFGVDEYNTAVVADASTITFDGGTDDKYQKLTGSTTLTGNQTYALGTGVNGDEFWLEYDADTTVAGNNLVIFGITLSDEQALGGGLMFRAKYMEGAWRSYVTPNVNAGMAVPFKVPTELYGADSVGVAAVKAELKTELIVVDVSFESNRLGDYKIKFPYACTVVEINAWATNTIEATDDADLNFKDNAAASMGTESFTAGDTIGTGITTITPSSNNVFLINQIMTITSTKSTAGGDAKCSLKILKT
jgi:hypothetical protein